MTSPFGREFEDVSCSFMPKLDAVYIPALASRDKPSFDMEQLLRYTEKVFFLFSDVITDWGIQMPSKVKLISMEKQTSFIKQYILQRGNINPSVEFRPNFDIPLKRSYALFDARKNSFRSILLLDDDILITQDTLKKGISALAHGVSVMGFHVVDYPDVSTLDHISRIVCEKENVVSMTGSCMFINVDEVTGDFPNVYNEDLFFFMMQPRQFSVVSGGFVRQCPYESFQSLDRVKHEQFGDLIYDAIKKRFLGYTNDRIDWDFEIEDRIKYIDYLHSQTTNSSAKQALVEAKNAISCFSKKDITDFLSAYPFAEWVTKYL